MEKEHNVSTCDDWIEVTSKFSSNSNTVRNPESLLAYQPIPTYSKYAHVINLQDTTVNIINATVSNEQGLHCVSQRVDQQTEAISKETNCVHYIPTILNGKIYSMVPTKRVNGVIKSTVKQDDEIHVYNSPYTVNVQKQISIKHSSKVAIVSDSHLKGCTMKINNHLGDTFRITGWTKPGALAEELLDKPIMGLVNLNKQNVVVISAGANDLYMNNSSVALLKITKFIHNNCNTNMIIYGVPHRYDLAEYSCVNRAIRAFNCKLKKVATLFRHVTLFECNYGREYFTNHGMHLNGRGKRRVSKQLASVISKLTAVETITPINL